MLCGRHGRPEAESAPRLPPHRRCPSPVPAGSLTDAHPPSRPLRSIDELEERVGDLAAERAALATAAADLEQDRACAAHGEAVAAAEARHLRATVDSLEARTRAPAWPWGG